MARSHVMSFLLVMARYRSRMKAWAAGLVSKTQIIVEVMVMTISLQCARARALMDRAAQLVASVRTDARILT